MGETRSALHRGWQKQKNWAKEQLRYHFDDIGVYRKITLKGDVKEIADECWYEGEIMHNNSSGFLSSIPNEMIFKFP
jgi:hypothetical protein